MNAQHAISTLRTTCYQAALDLAAANPAHYIEVFVDAWNEVDRCRAHAADHGLSGRIGIHHRIALDALIEMNVLPKDDDTGNADPIHSSLTVRLHASIRAAAFAFATKLTVLAFR